MISCINNPIKGRFRVVIAVLLFLGQVGQTIVVNNVVFAIDAMVLEIRPTINQTEQDICYPRKITKIKINPSSYGSFDWNVRVQGSVLGIVSLGSFFGTFASVWVFDFVTTRIVYSGALIMGGLMNLAFPDLAIHSSTFGVLCLRLFTGLYTGVLTTGISSISSRWFPVQERGRVLSFAFLGSNFGRMTFAFTGAVIDAFGWPGVFRITGGFCLFSGLCFLCLFDDDPQQHDFVTEMEKAKINGVNVENWSTHQNWRYHKHGEQTEVEEIRKLPLQRRLLKKAHDFWLDLKIPVKSKTLPPIPWRSVLLSKCYWAVVFGQFGIRYINATALVYTPMYLMEIQGFTLQDASIVASLPTNISMIVFGLIIGWLNDKCIANKYMSKTILRRLGGVILIVSCTLFVTVPLAGCQFIHTFIIPMVILTSLQSGAFMSVIQSYQDISPTFAKNIGGLSWTLSMLTGFIVSGVMGSVGKSTIHEWKINYTISSVVSITCILVYIMFVDAKVQPWDPNFNRLPAPDYEADLKYEGSYGNPYMLFKKDVSLEDEQARITKLFDKQKAKKIQTYKSVLASPAVLYYLFKLQDININEH